MTLTFEFPFYQKQEFADDPSFENNSWVHWDHCLQTLRKNGYLILPCVSSRLSRSLKPFFFTWILTPRAIRSDSSIWKYSLVSRIKVDRKFSGHFLLSGESSIIKRVLILQISRHNKLFVDRTILHNYKTKKAFPTQQNQQKIFIFAIVTNTTTCQVAMSTARNWPIACILLITCVTFARVTKTKAERLWSKDCLPWCQIFQRNVSRKPKTMKNGKERPWDKKV